MSMCDEPTMADYYMDYDRGPFLDPAWQAKDGRLVVIREMDDAYLLNVVRFLRRNAAAYKMAELKRMGAYISNLSDDEYLSHRFRHSYPALMAQVKGRGLTV